MITMIAAIAELFFFSAIVEMYRNQALDISLGHDKADPNLHLLVLRIISTCLQVLNVTRSVIRFINLISLMLLVAHWNGCMQYLVPVLNDFPDDSWVTIHGLRVSLVPAVVRIIGLFRVASSLCFKARLSTKPLI